MGSIVACVSMEVYTEMGCIVAFVSMEVYTEMGCTVAVVSIKAYSVRCIVACVSVDVYTEMRCIVTFVFCIFRSIHWNWLYSSLCINGSIPVLCAQKYAVL